MKSDKFYILKLFQSPMGENLTIFTSSTVNLLGPQSFDRAYLFFQGFLDEIDMESGGAVVIHGYRSYLGNIYETTRLATAITYEAPPIQLFGERNGLVILADLGRLVAKHLGYVPVIPGKDNSGGREGDSSAINLLSDDVSFVPEGDDWGRGPPYTVFLADPDRAGYVEEIVSKLPCDYQIQRVNLDDLLGGASFK